MSDKSKPLLWESGGLGGIRRFVKERRKLRIEFMPTEEVVRRVNQGPVFDAMVVLLERMAKINPYGDTENCALKREAKVILNLARGGAK